ncbi:hypothetical protein AAFF_G00373430 [Aldrovandia affinis]|uniref:Uncharacterized protein n=1 Tax=Aldrovandia affinis TaxID=143900 RepID=A0AAD7SGV0_9TELE|nr:hypothetical protein AAFF_G00373430 [Aldrovandia affinis]
MVVERAPRASSRPRSPPPPPTFANLINECRRTAAFPRGEAMGPDPISCRPLRCPSAGADPCHLQCEPPALRHPQRRHLRASSGPWHHRAEYPAPLYSVPYPVLSSDRLHFPVRAREIDDQTASDRGTRSARLTVPSEGFEEHSKSPPFVSFA